MTAEANINIVIGSFLFSIFLQFVPYYCIQEGTEIVVAGKYANTQVPDLVVLSKESAAALSKSKRSVITSVIMFEVRSLQFPQLNLGAKQILEGGMSS